MLNPQDAVDELLVELQQLQQAQQMDPTDATSPYQAGVIYNRLGDPGSAVRSFQTAVERDPRFVLAQFSLALALSALELWVEAEQAYQAVLWLDDKDHATWANLGGVYEAMGRPGEALTAYRRAIQINPGEREARHRIGNIHLAQGEWQRADAAFEEAIAVNEEDYEAWNSLGLVAFHQERDTEARDYYLKAIQVHDGFARAWCNLGNVFARMSEDKSAEDAYREAVAREENDPDLWFNMGEFYFRRGRTEAERCLLNAVRLNPEDLEAWEMIRDWNSRHPKLPVWKMALERLLDNKPDDLSLLREMANVQNQLGESSEALGVLRKLISLDESDEESRLMLAKLYLFLGRPMDACTHLQLLKGDSEDVMELWNNVGQRLLHQNETGAAETCFLALAAHRPLQTDAWQFLGELAMARREWELAYERFTRAVDQNRNDASVWLPIARGLLEQEQFEKATACLDNLEEHLLYLPGDWDLFYSIYSQAGAARPLLKKLEALMGRGMLGDHLWLKLAELYADAGLDGDSRRCFAHLEESGVSGEAAELAMAHYYLRAKDANQALRYLDRLRDALGENPEYWRDRAEAYYQLGNMDRAREGYEKALALDDSDFRSWFNLGNIFYRGNNLEDALRCFMAAAELGGEESKVWYNLGVVQDELGQDSRIALRRAINANRRFSQAWNALGVLYFKENEVQLARRCFVRCVAVNRESVLGWYNLAMCYTRMKKKSDADHCLERVRQLGGLPEEGIPAAVRLFREDEDTNGGGGGTKT